MTTRRRWLAAMVVALIDATGRAASSRASRQLSPADDAEEYPIYSELTVTVAKATRRGMVIRYSDPINPTCPLLTLQALTGQAVPLLEVQDERGFVVGGLSPSGKPFGTLGTVKVERVLRRRAPDYGDDNA